MWFLSASTVQFLTFPSCNSSLCQGWELGQTWNLFLPAASAGISEGHQQNSLSFGFNKWNIILPMKKLHQLILGFCSFRWFMSLILFIYLYLGIFTGFIYFSQSNPNPKDASQSCPNCSLGFPLLKQLLLPEIQGGFFSHHAEASGLLRKYWKIFSGPKREAKLSHIHA